jgi:hypothetical protein
MPFLSIQNKKRNQNWNFKEIVNENQLNAKLRKMNEVLVDCRKGDCEKKLPSAMHTTHFVEIFIVLGFGLLEEL